MKYRYLTFDCYGTLIDWKKGIEASMKRAAGDLPVDGATLLKAYVEAEKKEEESYKKYREVLRRAALNAADRLRINLSDTSAQKFSVSVPDWPAFPDTADFLHRMGKAGYKRYILSNVDTDMLEATIAKNRLEVDGFVTAEEAGSYKPAPGHWSTFFRKTGAEKGEVLHVAQSIFHDIVPTQAMGVSSAWVDRYAEPLPLSAQPGYISDSLERLAPLLE